MAGFSFFREASMVLSGDCVVVGGGEVCNESHTRSEKINLEITLGRISPTPNQARPEYKRRQSSLTHSWLLLTGLNIHASMRQSTHRGLTEDVGV